MGKETTPPLLLNKHFAAASHFRPENLLREARRQQGRKKGRVPAVCVLDPDGDATRGLLEGGRARRDPSWACYHTNLYEFSVDGRSIGIVPFAVGASFAVLVAEELFVSGCRLLISVTSSGRIDPRIQPPLFLLIDKALRDEGTSYHYLPPSDFASLNRRLRLRLRSLLGQREPRVVLGATWTTDAPFRETPQAISHARRRGIQAVEMEAAALYAFAKARGKAVVCFALVTNQMGAVEGDFEKGCDRGLDGFLSLIRATGEALLVRQCR